ncbi:cell wall-binding repeat-containing protein [Metabacillus idriensis]|uniref:cell wall-binding repeat-containing protein n=1 Tax=Metabacillus idriensis TaxID=324768 RepID=UPI00174BACAB|nr:cell wall-binding repeat-containing protein [Metabacillus idriensis]
MLKKMKLVPCILMSILFLLVLPSFSQASVPEFNVVESKVKQVCKYDPQAQKGKDIPYQTANCLLTNVALELEVPAEIVKAVTTQEKGDWQQFENGQPIVSDDGGIGMMQITVYPAKDEEALKNNAIFNIYSGVKILNNYLTAPIKSNQSAPLIQKDDPSFFLEKWYFSIMRYNGIKPINSPLAICNGNNGRNLDAYQEEVFNLIKTVSGGQDINTKVHLLEMDAADFTYTCGSSENINFNKTDFKLNAPLTETKHQFNKNDTLITFNEDVETPRVRKEPRGGSPIVTSGKDILVKTTGSFVYDSGSASLNQFVWYPVQIKNSETKGYVASSYLKRILTRLEGENRYQTAVEISKEGWKQSDTVVIATGSDYPDALSGTPLAAKYDAPLLLVDKRPASSGSLPAKYNALTKQEISRLKAKKAIILGDVGVVPKAFENELINMGLTVSRIAGANRYETSAKIAEYLSSDTAIVTYGKGFPDAISVASYASKKGIPILLTDKSSLPEETKNALTRFNQSIVIGSDAVITNAVYNQLPKPKRYGGNNRFETSKIVAEQLKLGQNEVFIATGMDYPDALSGAVLAAKLNASILLLDNRGKYYYNEPLKETIDQFPSATILGSESAIGTSLENDIINLVKK